MQVADKFQQVALLLAQDRPITPLKEVPNLTMALVVVARETVKQTLHDFGQRVVFHLDKKVNMVRHQNIGVELKGIPLLSLPQNELESSVVAGVLKNALALVAPADDMVEGSRKMDARPPSHEGALTLNGDQKQIIKA